MLKEEEYYDSYRELLDKLKSIKKNGWAAAAYNRYSSVGVTFEKLLGKPIESFEIPDYKGIEIKTKLSDDRPYITLFNATPDSYLYEIKRIHLMYGYPDKKNSKYKVFNMSISNKHKLGNLYLFEIVVDREKSCVQMIVRDLGLNIIDKATSWSFDMLEEKLNRKLKYLLVVKAKRRFFNGDLYFKYEDAKLYSCKDFEHFLKAIENGHIRITFKISVFRSGKRIGQIHDHGTGFDIHINYLEKLFDYIETS